MKRKPVSCVIIFIMSLFVIQTNAQFSLTQALPVDPLVKIGKLPNGLTYYIRKNAKPEKKVELRLAVNAGSILEDNEQQGLAHFMEHMNFNGTKNFRENQLVDYLQKIGVKFGADLNAYTGFDETVYILPIPSDNADIVEKGFTVLEDWAGNNLFETNEIEKERGVVLEESRLSKGSGERMRRQYFPHLFRDSKYAIRLPIGKDSILKSFRPEVLRKFYKDWYRPNLMAVIVVGDIDPAVAEKKIIAHFSKFKNPANPRIRPAITSIKNWTTPEAMVVTDDEATNTIVQVFNFVQPAQKIKTWGDYRQSIVQNLFSSLVNQRLSELTQKENPPFVFGSTGFNEFLRGYKAFTSFAFLGQGKVEDAVNALVSETERARQFGFLQAELDRAKANMLNSAEEAYKERDKSESANIVDEYVNNFLDGTAIPGVVNDYKFIKQVLPTISLSEVNAIAKKMPAPTNAFTLVTAPSTEKSKLPDDKTLLSEVVAAIKRPVTPYEEKAIAKSLMDQEPAPGKVTEEKTNAKLGTTDYTLSNGVTVTIKPTTYKNDQILMDAWRLGGYSKFDLSDKDNAQYAAIIVQQMGVKDFSPTDLEKFLSGKTVSATPYINENEDGIEGSSSVKDFETFLQLTNLYFTQPRKDESLFNSFINKQKGMVQFLAQNPRAFYQDTLTKIAYNNNPWAGGIPKPSTFANINLDKSLAAYKNIFGNAYGMHFTFVGNIDPAKAKPLVEKYLGSLPASQEENMFKDNGVRLVKGLVDVNVKKGKEPQSFITLLFQGDAQYSREERMNLQALIEVLNIKIIEKLREEMSGVYGAGMRGSIDRRPYVHYSITASVPCGPENVDKLTTALLGLMKDAQTKVEQKDLDKVKETWKKQYETNIQNNEFWLGGLSNAWINQDNPENILDYEQKVNEITVDGVQKAAQKFLTLNDYVKVVLYPENATIKDDGSGKKAF